MSNLKDRWAKYCKILIRLPDVYEHRLTHGVLEVIRPQRSLYYSTLLAIATGALGYLSTFLNKAIYAKFLLVLSVAFLSLTILCIILIYFNNLIHNISWQYYVAYRNSDNKEAYVENRVNGSLDDAFVLMGIGAYADLLLLAFFLFALVCFSSFMVVNIL